MHRTGHKLLDCQLNELKAKQIPLDDGYRQQPNDAPPLGLEAFTSASPPGGTCGGNMAERWRSGMRTFHPAGPHLMDMVGH